MTIGTRHLNILARKCKDLEAYWEKLGQALGLPQTRIDAITEKYAHVTSASCTVTMLQKWHDSRGKTATWRVLYVAAQRVEKNSLAREIKQKVPCLDNEGGCIHTIYLEP